ncbi:MAG: DUF3144 domain-containing protein [Patescibacteria group bacterium]|jgi:hypothetical protein
MRKNIKKIDREFLDIENSFIDLANKHCDSGDHKKVSIAFLHAAARFNAFEVWASAADIAEFKSEKNTEKKYFEAIYKKRLDEEFNEFETNFDRYKKELAI